MKWFELGLLWLLDLIVAAAFAQLAPFGEKLPWFFMAVAFLWLTPVILGALWLAKFWLSYHLYMKRRLVRHFKAKMHENGFPSSAAYVNYLDYLSHVMDEGENRAKLKAAAFVGEITCYKDSKPFTMGVACQAALEAAMEEYRP